MNIQGAGLKVVNNRAGSASRKIVKSKSLRADVKQTPCGLRADERTPSEPLADPKQTQIFKKTDPQRTLRELKANPESAFGVRSGISMGLVGNVINLEFMVANVTLLVPTTADTVILKTLLVSGWL